MNELNSYRVTITWNRLVGGIPVYPSNVYKFNLKAKDAKAARHGALLLAHFEGCTRCRVSSVRQVKAA